MNIIEFATDYKNKNYPHDFRLMKRVIVTDVSTSTLVWIDGQFLVELYMMHPNTIVKRHSHPFENITIFFSGVITGSRQGNNVGHTLTELDHGRIGVPLPENHWHEFTVGNQGAVFYNISRWSNPTEMDSAIIKYHGEPLGPVHSAFLESLKNKW
jgi:hypothetical protein